MANYYDQHAESFIENTLNIDMRSLYSKFVPHLPSEASVLDAGCGAGRDVRFFAKSGFTVTAFDASDELVKFAQNYTNQNIQQCRFTEFQSAKKFDGIWACASLLHVPFNELTNTFAHLSSFLADDGVFYCSFKLGKNEVIRDGRTFTNLTQFSLEKRLQSTKLKIKELWITTDLRKERKNEQWLNALLELR